MKRLLILLLLAVPVGAQTKKHHTPPPPPPDMLTFDPMSWSKSNIVLSPPGPTVEIIVTDGDKATDLIRIYDKDGKLLLIVHMDGSVTTDNGYQADETARLFWTALADAYGKMCAVPK